MANLHATAGSTGLSKTDQLGENNRKIGERGTVSYGWNFTGMHNSLPEAYFHRTIGNMLKRGTMMQSVKPHRFSDG